MRLFRRLLCLLPEDLRRHFGRDMELLLADRLRDLDDHPIARLRLIALASADLVWHAAAERLTQRRRAGQRWRTAQQGRLAEWGQRRWTREGRGLVMERREAMAEGRGMVMDGLSQDLGYGMRSLRRRPGFTLAVLLTLGLGIGATVSIFSVVNAVLLRPLPYPDPDRLFVVRTVNEERGSRSDNVDHPDIRAWQERVDGARVAAYAGTRPTLTGQGEPEVLYGARVTDGLITLMGLTPILGRDLGRDDDVYEGPRVVVLSHELWISRLGRDPDVLGRTLTLDGEPWEVIGVAPADFDFPDGAQLWLPRRHDPDGCGHGCRVMRAVGRLEAGTTLDAAQARFDAVTSVLATEFPEAHRYERTELHRLIDVEVADVRVGLWVLLGAVVMLLLVACANVANLMLVRSDGRRGELALRATLGASRGRIARQLLTESLILATGAGMLGLALAMAGTEALVSMAPDSLPRLDGVGIDTTVVGFTALLVAAVTTAFGLLPARRLSDASLSRSMGSARRASAGPRAGRFRSTLLAGEVALSLTLLLGAGLLLRTLREARAVDLGFATEHVERFRISAPESRYDSLSVPDFFERLERDLQALPEVAAVGLGFNIPLASGSITTSVRLLDRPEVPPEDRAELSLRAVTPGYLEASGIALTRGRWFTFGDRRDADPVAVINEAAAARYYPDRDPLGASIGADVSWGFEEDPARTVVGVVANVRGRSPTREPEPAIYIPNAQFSANVMYVSMRLAPGVASAMDPARDVIATLDADLAVVGVHRIEDAVRDALAPTRFYLTLLTVFSVLALLLAAVGLYGVVAFLVARRTREIGVRLALGATSHDVIGMVLRQGARPAVAGMGAGLAISLLGSGLLGSLLYGVAPRDPLALLSTTALLGTVVALSIALPARRAAAVSPATALQAE